MTQAPKKEFQFIRYKHRITYDKYSYVVTAKTGSRIDDVVFELSKVISNGVIFLDMKTPAHKPRFYEVKMEDGKAIYWRMKVITEANMSNKLINHCAEEHDLDRRYDD